jgi:hypothetical protein
VAKVVEPKRQALSAAQDQLAAANAALEEKQSALRAVVGRVEGLRRQLADTQAEQKRLNEQVGCDLAGAALVALPAALSTRSEARGQSSVQADCRASFQPSDALRQAPPGVRHQIPSSRAPPATQAELTRKRLERAAKLTSGLADEGVRWGATADAIRAATALLVGDVFVAAGAIAYLGAFTGAFRWGRSRKPPHGLQAYLSARSAGGVCATA